MSTRSRSDIGAVDGPHRFDTYGEYVRVNSCTKKIRYATEDEAIGAAIRVSCRSGRPMRTYRCDRCRGWHITGKSARAL